RSGRNARRAKPGAVYAAAAARLQGLRAVSNASRAAATAGMDAAAGLRVYADARIGDQDLPALRRDPGSRGELLQSMRTPAARRLSEIVKYGRQSLFAAAILRNGHRVRRRQLPPSERAVGSRWLFACHREWRDAGARGAQRDGQDDGSQTYQSPVAAAIRRRAGRGPRDLRLESDQAPPPDRLCVA